TLATEGSRDSFSTRRESFASNQAIPHGIDVVVDYRRRCRFGDRLLGRARPRGGVAAKPVECNAVSHRIASQYRHSDFLVRTLTADRSDLWSRTGHAVFKTRSQRSTQGRRTPDVYRRWSSSAQCDGRYRDRAGGRVAGRRRIDDEEPVSTFENKRRLQN